MWLVELLARGIGALLVFAAVMKVLRRREFTDSLVELP